MALIIDLTYITPEIDPLDTWIINDKRATASEYEVIVCNQSDPKAEAGSMVTRQEVTESGVRVMFEDSRKEAAKV